MRFVLLASAALCMSAGAAMAQTSMTAPAPTGAPNGAMASPAPNMSPGNMAPSGAMTPAPQMSGQNSMKMTTSPASPAPTGAPNAAQITPPGASPGNMAPNHGAEAMEPMGAAPMKRAVVYGGMAMPEDADVKTYLHIAAKAIHQRDKVMADDALSHAETRLLTRAVPASAGIQPDDSPSIDAIEHAREALAAGDYRQAQSDTKMAMHAHHAMMGGGMSPMDGTDATGGPAQ